MDTKNRLNDAKALTIGSAVLLMLLFALMGALYGTGAVILASILMNVWLFACVGLDTVTDLTKRSAK